MPPKRGDRGGGFMGGLGATISTLISDPEPTRERGAGHAGGGGGSGGGRSATESTKDKGNAQAAAAASRNATELSAILGLAELVEVLNVMATTPPGVPPQLNQTLINRIKNSPLSPVIKELDSLYTRLSPPEGSQEPQAQGHNERKPIDHLNLHLHLVPAHRQSREKLHPLLDVFLHRFSNRQLPLPLWM